MPMLVAGLVFSTLAVILPTSHLGARLGGLDLALLTLPVAALGAVLVYPGRALLSHFAFPASHLPYLLLHPELAAAKIYAGATGHVALLAVLAAGAAYIVAATPRLPASRARVEPLVLIGLALALAPTLAFLVPALGAASTGAPPSSVSVFSPAAAGRWASLLALLLGPLLAWFLVARSFVQQVAMPVLDPSSRVRALYSLRERLRPRPPIFVLAALLAALALGITAFWYLWSPR